MTDDEIIAFAKQLGWNVEHAQTNVMLVRFAKEVAAAELRRLHEENAELLKALKNIDKEFKKDGRQHWPEAVKTRKAIAKATSIKQEKA